MLLTEHEKEQLITVLGSALADPEQVEIREDAFILYDKLIAVWNKTGFPTAEQIMMKGLGARILLAIASDRDLYDEMMEKYADYPDADDFTNAAEHDAAVDAAELKALMKLIKELLKEPS